MSIIDLVTILVLLLAAGTAFTQMGRRALNAFFRRIIMDEKTAVLLDARKASIEKAKINYDAKNLPVLESRQDELQGILHKQRVTIEQTRLEAMEHERELLNGRYAAKLEAKDYEPLPARIIPPALVGPILTRDVLETAAYLEQFEPEQLRTRLAVRELESSGNGATR